MKPANEKPSRSRLAVAAQGALAALCGLVVVVVALSSLQGIYGAPLPSPPPECFQAGASDLSLPSYIHAAWADAGPGTEWRFHHLTTNEHLAMTAITLAGALALLLLILCV